MILVKLFKMTLVMLLGELRKLGILLLQLFGMLVVLMMELLVVLPGMLLIQVLMGTILMTQGRF